MTTFVDGPARGQTLMLRRAARYLRVTEANGKFDALDQPEDTPQPTEKLYAYRCVGQPTMCHVRMSGGRGGMYPIASYELVNPQPTDAEMRDTMSWRAWAERQGKQQ